jgi:hypothetical protein
VITGHDEWVATQHLNDLGDTPYLLITSAENMLRIEILGEFECDGVLLASLMECQTEAAPRHCPANPRRLTDPRSPFDPRNPHRYMFGLPDGYVLLPYRGVKFYFCSGT